MINWRIRAYVVLVQGGIYILDEVDRTTDSQKLVPEIYLLEVAENLI